MLSNCYMPSPPPGIVLLLFLRVGGGVFGSLWGAWTGVSTKPILHFGADEIYICIHIYIYNRLKCVFVEYHVGLFCAVIFWGHKSSEVLSPLVIQLAAALYHLVAGVGATCPKDCGRGTDLFGLKDYLLLALW